MRRQSLSRSFVFRIGSTIQGVLVALLLPVVGTAAPPDGMFPRVSVPSEHLAALAILSPFGPGVGPYAAVADLYAGTHPNFQMWTLRGEFSTKAGRIEFGAGLLFLTGFGSTAETPLMELVMLQAGEERDCWTLIDTDVVRPFPEEFLKPGIIRDRTPMSTGNPECEAYWQMLVQAHYTSAKAFAKAARRDVSYFNLFNEPAHYRGQVVHVSGRLIRLVEYPPSDEASVAGLGHLYEGWIMTDAFGENPVGIAFTDLPPGLTVDNERKYNERVTFDGYFFKRYRYTAGDSKKINEFRDAPLLIGHTVNGRFQGPGDGEDASESWGHRLIWVFLSVVAGTLFGLIGLTFWFRYHDRRVRERIHASRHKEFVPPPAEMFDPEREPPANGNGDSGDPPARQPASEWRRGSNGSD